MIFLTRSASEGPPFPLCGEVAPGGWIPSPARRVLGRRRIQIRAHGRRTNPRGFGDSRQSLPTRRPDSKRTHSGMSARKAFGSPLPTCRPDSKRTHGLIRSPHLRRAERTHGGLGTLTRFCRSTELGATGSASNPCAASLAEPARVRNRTRGTLCAGAERTEEPSATRPSERTHGILERPRKIGRGPTPARNEPTSRDGRDPSGPALRAKQSHFVPASLFDRTNPRGPGGSGETLTAARVHRFEAGPVAPGAKQSHFGPGRPATERTHGALGYLA
jgi:hypothetical protein